MEPTWIYIKPPEPSVWPELSPLEVVVVRAWYDGRQTKELARELDIPRLTLARVQRDLRGRGIPLNPTASLWHRRRLRDER